jgi:succinate dehydrogenase (ubiquinone) cytochrome b560 subunit
MTPEDSLSILAAQRKLRPTSPHLAIYRPQITWYLSMLNRITGATLSGGLYIFGAAYLVSPLTGWDLSSASMAATFAAWPLLVQLGLKMTLALPFTFRKFEFPY